MALSLAMVIFGKPATLDLGQNWRQLMVLPKLYSSKLPIAVEIPLPQILLTAIFRATLTMTHIITTSSSQ